jgi:uncharacterized protein YndB with AHSA1/START domain
LPRVEAERELLASREQAWGFLEEPRHLADWWPGIGSVEPDRRGLEPGARWQLRRGSDPSLLRGAHATSMLLVREVERPRRVTWHMTAERLDVELRLDIVSPGRTLAVLSVTAPWWALNLRSALPRDALGRLHALCQTAATL